MEEKQKVRIGKLKKGARISVEKSTFYLTNMKECVFLKQFVS